jgi:hypothetical protein
MANMGERDGRTICVEALMKLKVHYIVIEVHDIE